MSKNASCEHLGSKRPKRKASKSRLPTPPPDPTTSAEFAEPNTKSSRKISDKDAEIFEYLESLQKEVHPLLGRPSVFAPAIAAEDAFDHLEKLYKLMEQMLTLREQNAKLHRRVRDLEHLRNLQSMHRQLDNAPILEDVPELDSESVYAERLLETMLLDFKKDSKYKMPSRLRQSILRRQRNRSCSMAVDKPPGDLEFKRERRASTPMADGGPKHAKVSKWTKVKAAFKWEKASPTVSEVKSCETGGLVPVNYELARYLRVPSTNDEMGTSITDSGAAEISTPGTISLSSSIDDMQGYDGRKEDARDYSSDDDQSYSHDYIPHSKDEHNRSRKSRSKGHRTPWAKMKDIIQTRNSLKKKHRLSTKSDDVKIEGSICSDNEDVFEDPRPTKIQFVDRPIYAKSKSFAGEDTSRIPIEIIERYHQLVTEEVRESKSQSESKWNRVKKAFLASPSVSADSYNFSNRSIDADLKHDPFAVKREQDSKLQEEIQRNYKDLQQKLSLEFQDKFHEWERVKQAYSAASACSSTGTPSVLSHEDSKDQAFMKKIEEWEKIKAQPRLNLQLTSEENLPPEFKKKLQEWQKIKKSSMKEDNSKKKMGDRTKWKSVGGYKSDMEQRPLSDEFLKKLETWKQIKAAAATSCDECSSKRSTLENKTPSPKMGRKDSGNRQTKKLKEQTEKELQWFEKELNKIEREKQRLERERQKFLEREERLSKLRRTVVGHKKEVLVHTPSGFYRFEGISRKFTQKLYEWEKAQGIAPEASTFALLKSCYPREGRINAKQNNTKSVTLYRSKSADSIAKSSLNLLCPILNEQPSSLSLNDVENFENNLMQSRVSSIPDMARSDENLSQNEPQAVIVEVEDIIEETAAPLESFLEKREKPIYQQEDSGKLLESKRNSGPKVRRSESTRAQTNYNLIEKIIDLLRTLKENERRIELAENHAINLNELILKENHKTSVCDQENDLTLKRMYDKQRRLCNNLVEKIIFLQQANSAVASKISREGVCVTPTHLEEDLESVQDLSSELLQMAEKLELNAYNRSKHFSNGNSLNYTQKNYSSINFMLSQLSGKICETRRILSYICAASDTTAPARRKKMIKRNTLSKTPSKESKHSETEESHSAECEDSKKLNRNNSIEEAPIPVGQGAIKKRIRYKQKDVHHKTVDESDEDSKDSTKLAPSKCQVTIMRMLSDERVRSAENAEEIHVDAQILEKVVVPTKSTILSLEDLAEAVSEQKADTAVTVFVKTTRKLFTPIAGIEDTENPPKGISTLRQISSSSESVQLQRNKRSVDGVSEEDCCKIIAPVTRLPPLPASPTPQRKFKEISPSIRIMMVKYNQKVSEQESSGYRSGGSSGSASPVAWISPVMERRVRAQTERYQEELNKMSPLLERREVQKSASLGFLHSGNKQLTVHRSNKTTTDPSGILKSSSVGVISVNEYVIPDDNKKEKPQKKPLKLSIPIKEKVSDSQPDVRARRIQKAKEAFLNSPVPGSSSAPPHLVTTEADFLKYPARSRLSQISVGSDTSCDSSACEGWLVKSASAGMINIDPLTYKQFDPTVHGDGYVSLPRASKKHRAGILNNITSKFRKVKMRRNREPNKMNTISTLCRQSLVVDINENAEGLQAESRQDSLTVPSISGASSSEDTSAPSSRSGSWIRRAKLFKPKQ